MPELELTTRSWTGTSGVMDGESRFDAGEVLAGQFRILKKIGEGGMGAMYLAEQLHVGRRVAVKIVHGSMVSDRPELLERFKREARALAQLQHPNVVQLYSVGETDRGLPFLAMEYVDGETLADALKRGPMRLDRAVDITRQIASALGQSHARGVIHRDLKPANIMLACTARGGELVKVVDFGIAKTFDRTDNLTVTGTFFGTPQYVAPEQVRTQPVDARTDLYALGLVFYEMLTGRSPFNGQSAFDLLAQQVGVHPDPPSHRRLGLPAAIDAIVLRCLEKLPEHRYPCAGALLRDLDCALRPAAERDSESPSSVEHSVPHDERPLDLPQERPPREPYVMSYTLRVVWTFALIALFTIMQNTAQRGCTTNVGADVFFR